jgi:hypothetical protein
MQGRVIVFYIHEKSISNIYIKRDFLILSQFNVVHF